MLMAMVLVVVMREDEKSGKIMMKQGGIGVEDDEGMGES